MGAPLEAGLLVVLLFVVQRQHELVTISIIPSYFPRDFNEIE